MKNEDVLARLQRRFGALAEQLEEESMACAMAPIDIGGGESQVPALIVKAGPRVVLGRPLVRGQVLGIETSECPVLALGVAFPSQVRELAGWIWSWIPMHTAEQRRLLEALAAAPAWLVIIFSGADVTRALQVRLDDVGRARCRQLKRVIDSYPTHPEAEAQRAIDAAQAATAGALGEGWALETVRDLGPDQGQGEA